MESFRIGRWEHDWMGIPAGRYGSGARMLIKGVGGEVILLFYFFFI